jgi:hypothetical protein
MADIKWTGTALCLIGIALTSLNIYPLNLVFGLVGSALWSYSGFRQMDWALFLVEVVATTIYFFGVVWYVIEKIKH